MLKNKPARPKSAKGEGGGDGGTTDKPSKGGAAASSATSASSSAKKRRPSQKKKDSDDKTAPSPQQQQRGAASSAAAAAAAMALRSAQEDHRRYYQRAPRLLPEITGVRALSATEVSSDLKLLHTALAAYEHKLQALLPPGGVNPVAAGGGVYLQGNREPTAASAMADDAAYGAFMFQKRRARANGVITPEEVVESLPVCRRAVRITQRELAAMKRERDDLERDFMRHRATLLWQLGEIKRIQNQQDRVLRVLSKDVVDRAKTLEASRRRTNALQDIMNELENRGSAIVRLTREKHQLETRLRKHGLELPEAEELYVGDRIECQFGQGHITAMDETTRVLTIELRNGGTAHIHEEHAEVLPTEISYLEEEKALKQKFFEKIGALVQPNGRLSLLTTTGGRRRSRLEMDDSDADIIDGDEDVEGEDDGDEDEDGEPDEEESIRRRGDANPTDNSTTTGDAVAADESRKKKKRKLMPPPASATAKKKQKSNRLLDFTACKIPITPYDCGLLVSPLSVLPEKVAAVGPGALQWMSSYLPGRMADWEQDRYHAFQMQGDIERLQFQLQKAEAEKEDAQQHASEQLDSINQLVQQVEKLREQLAARDARDKEAPNGCPSCPNCSSSSNTSKKSSSSSTSKAKQNGRSSGSKNNAAGRRQRTESMGDVDDDDTKSTRSRQDDDDDDLDGKDPNPTQDEEFDEGSEHSDTSRPTQRSLRPRRASSNSSAQSNSNSKSK